MKSTWQTQIKLAHEHVTITWLPLFIQEGPIEILLQNKRACCQKIKITQSGAASHINCLGDKGKYIGNIIIYDNTHSTAWNLSMQTSQPWKTAENTAQGKSSHISLSPTLPISHCFKYGRLLGLWGDLGLQPMYSIAMHADDTVCVRNVLHRGPKHPCTLHSLAKSFFRIMKWVELGVQFEFQISCQLPGP